jgi:heme-degrading monooxygenase HmoA
MRPPTRLAAACAAIVLGTLGAVATRAAEPPSRAPALPLVRASENAPAANKGIARIWRGRTTSVKADEYEAYLFASGITKVRQTPGNRGVTVLRREDGGQTEFLVISIWDSLDAVKRFAGRDYDKAVILERDREYLVEVEPTVRHYAIEKEERAN